MNQFKECDVVMLTTNEKAPLILNQFGGLQLTSKIGDKYNQGLKQQVDISNHKFQHLYITSNDEIKEGEILPYLMKWENGYELFNSNNGIAYSRLNRAKRIIATTDDSIACIKDTLSIKQRKGLTNNYPIEKWVLPQPSIQFITKFIKEYIKGNIITKVKVEYEKSTYEDWIKTAEAQPEFKLKVNPKDNTITIKKVKDTWTKDEVKQLCWQAFINHKCIDGKIKTSTAVELIEPFSEWIEQNL